MWWVIGSMIVPTLAHQLVDPVGHSGDMVEASNGKLQDAVLMTPPSPLYFLFSSSLILENRIWNVCLPSALHTRYQVSLEHESEF